MTVKFCKCFFCISWYDCIFLSLLWWIMLIDFSVEPILHCILIVTSWLQHIILLIHYWILFACILLTVFTSTFMGDTGSFHVISLSSFNSRVMSAAQKSSMVAQRLSICLQRRSCRRCGFDPWVGKIPWRRAWQPTSVFLPGESHEEGSLLATVHRVTKSQTRLTDLAFMHTHLTLPA